MKFYSIIFFVCFLLILSCGGMRKSMKKSAIQSQVTDKTQLTKESVETEEVPIVEVQEKLVPVQDVPVDPHVYFVIIGSFRNLNNARNYQEQIVKDGFTPVLLRNEEGLYRISIKSTDDILTARSEILRIRSQFAKYEDTWLLIQIK